MFKPGDRVRRKGDGAEMTVQSVSVILHCIAGRYSCRVPSGDVEPITSDPSLKEDRSAVLTKHSPHREEMGQTLPDDESEYMTYRDVPELTHPISPKEITPGVLVRLKSGGPLMTVGSVESDRASCVWFVEGILHFQSISPAVLEVVS